VLLLLGEDFFDRVGVGEVGINFQCLLKLFFGHGVVVGFFVGHAEVVVKGGAVFPAFFDGLLKSVDRGRVGALIVIGPAESVGGAGIFGQSSASGLSESESDADVAAVLEH
jgi:hypothetical protein